MAEYYTVVLERPLAGQDAVNYTKMALEEQAKVTEPQPEEQVVKRNADETLAVVFLSARTIERAAQGADVRK